MKDVKLDGETYCKFATDGVLFRKVTGAGSIFLSWEDLLEFVLLDYVKNELFVTSIVVDTRLGSVFNTFLEGVSRDK